MLGLFKKRQKASSKNKRYSKLKIREVIRETDDTSTLVFEVPEEFSYLPGQYITLVFPIEGKEERRSYSLSSCPGLDEHPAVTVKRVDAGKVSNYLNDHMRVGDEFEIMAPAGSFTPDVSLDAAENYVMFAGGSGITPIFSIMKFLLRKNPGNRIVLIYQNRHEKSVIFQKELERLEHEYADRLTVHHILSRPEGEWKGKKGRIDNEIVKSILLDLPEFKIQDARYFVCGPSGMMDTVESALGDLKIPEKNVYKERFTPAKKKPETDSTSDDTELQTQTVTIYLDGDKHQVEVPPNKSILEAALDKDIDMPFSCQSGLCTACRGKLLKGKVYMEEDEGLSDDEIDEGYVLNCVGHPVTSDVEIEIG